MKVQIYTKDIHMGGNSVHKRDEGGKARRLILATDEHLLALTRGV